MKLKVDRFAKVIPVVVALMFMSSCSKDLNRSTENPEQSNTSTENPVGQSKNSQHSANNPKPSIFGGRAEATSLPTFLQVGKNYGFYAVTGQGVNGLQAETIFVKIHNIDNSGWIEVQALQSEFDTEARETIYGPGVEGPSFWLNTGMVSRVFAIE